MLLRAGRERGKSGALKSRWKLVSHEQWGPSLGLWPCSGWKCFREDGDVVPQGGSSPGIALSSSLLHTGTESLSHFKAGQ